jgi:beta-lactamase regulating signal transducer with metallopeptidase domain
MCNQQETLAEIKKELRGWKNIKIISLVGVVGAIVAATTFLVSLDSSVKSNEQAVSEVKETVKKVEQSQQNLELVVKEDQRTRRAEEGQRMTELKEAIKSVVTEVRRDKTPRPASPRVR